MNFTLNMCDIRSVEVTGKQTLVEASKKERVKDIMGSEPKDGIRRDNLLP